LKREGRGTARRRRKRGSWELTLICWRRKEKVNQEGGGEKSTREGKKKREIGEQQKDRRERGILGDFISPGGPRRGEKKEGKE